MEKRRMIQIAQKYLCINNYITGTGSTCCG